MLRHKRSIFSIFLILAFGLPLLAGESALDIVRKIDEKAAVETSIGRMSMLIFPYMHDSDNYRDLKVISYGKGDDDSYMEFVSPRSIKGLRILSLEGDQWVYFPSTGRVRKIAAKSKKESVKGVGGDFSYEDLGGGTLEEKYSFKILEKNLDEWILEGTPKEESAYSKLILHVGPGDYIVRKTEFYTDEEGHYKDLLSTDIKTISGRQIPTVMTMLNHHKESKTVVIIHEAQYDIEIDEKHFNPMRFYK